MSARLVSLFTLLPLAAAGCGINLDSEIDPNANTCTATSDCGAEGACVSAQTGDALCVATSADLGPVILEVRPNGGVASYVFFDVPAVVGENAKGMVQNHDIVLPESVSVTGEVAAPDGLSEACRGADGNLPVDITFTRRVEFGAFASRFEIPSPLTVDAGAAASFSAFVPPGSYDIGVFVGVFLKQGIQIAFLCFDAAIDFRKRDAGIGAWRFREKHRFFADDLAAESITRVLGFP